MAVTNTPRLAEEQRADGGTTFRFARTPPLPSYLLAFGVGPFDFVEARGSGQKAVRTRVIQPRGRAHAQGNATAEDFLAALSTEAGQDVSGVLGAFLDQPGAPLVTARLDCLARMPRCGCRSAASCPWAPRATRRCRGRCRCACATATARRRARPARCSRVPRASCP
ncbi:hypothetical protein [Melittangium boletus]|uniref:hypothetical protein n=1 Tax=Melittangium boletus TaxID=83453 RepID=UPI003DA59103